MMESPLKKGALLTEVFMVLTKTPAVRPETLNAFTQGWLAPSPDEINFVLDMICTRLHLDKKPSGADIAGLVGLSGKPGSGHGSRTFRRWMSIKDPTDVPFSAWAILCFEAGLGPIWALIPHHKSGATNASFRPETLEPFTKGWLPPDGDEIGHVLDLIRIRYELKERPTSAFIAGLIGLSGKQDSGSRTFRRWMSKGDPAKAPFAAWGILCFEAGLGPIWRFPSAINLVGTGGRSNNAPK